MNFTQHKPIFLQIVDVIYDNILQKKWTDDERISSVRELGMELGVNPNTVMRSYEYLQSEEIIYNKRGIGYFVVPNAQNKIIEMLRADFLKNELPSVIKKMKSLNISTAQLLSAIEGENL